MSTWELAHDKIVITMSYKAVGILPRPDCGPVWNGQEEAANPVKCRKAWSRVVPGEIAV